MPTGIINTGFCGFCGITFIPMLSRKPPANLNSGRKLLFKVKVMESDITDKATIAFCFHGIKSVAKCAMFSDYPIIELHRFFQRKTFRKILHNLLIAVHFCEWRYIIFSPRAQNKPFSFNHNNDDSRFSFINIVGVNSTI
ncbi:hypothetical protein IMSAG025_02264 [Muribaculaceae bacterium]|nr:hypothetical protein IMSAG025_02264 [Muribaculaceae bacterium]